MTTDPRVTPDPRVAREYPVTLPAVFDGTSLHRHLLLTHERGAFCVQCSALYVVRQVLTKVSMEDPPCLCNAEHVESAISRYFDTAIAEVMEQFVL